MWYDHYTIGDCASAQKLIIATVLQKNHPLLSEQTKVESWTCDQHWKMYLFLQFHWMQPPLQNLVWAVAILWVHRCGVHCIPNGQALLEPQSKGVHWELAFCWQPSCSWCLHLGQCYHHTFQVRYVLWTKRRKFYHPHVVGHWCTCKDHSCFFKSLPSQLLVC